MIKLSLIPDEETLDVFFEGDLDIDGTEAVEELLPIMEKYIIVHLNFGEVPFVDSSGMGILMNLVQTLHEKGIKVTVSHVRDDVMEVFQMLQLPDILGDGVFV